MGFLSSLPLPWLLFLISRTIPSSSQSTPQSCPEACGHIPVTFPFGIGPNCSLPGFQLSCNLHTHHLSLPGGQLRVLNISNGELRIDSSPFIASDCAGGPRNTVHLSLPTDSPFTFSGSSNRFIAIGCDTVAVVSDYDGSFTSGCVSSCASLKSIPRTTTAGGCSGVGCCEAAVPYGSRRLNLGAGSMFGYANVSAFDNCSYCFVAETGGYEFKVEDLRDFPSKASVSMRLDWAVGDAECSFSNLCGENGYCVPSPRGSGYLCNCLQGFKGNPYLNGTKGCQDVDECLDPYTSPCVDRARCRNTVPGYKCACPFGSSGDGMRNGSGCRKIFPVVEAILGTALVMGVLLLFGLWFYFALKHRALIKLREQYFRQNGGLVLKQQVSAREGLTDCTRIFSSEELQRATAGYSDNRILGTGGNGTVYKGLLDGGTMVAIKKSNAMDRAQIDQFINEIVILSQINHRNVVKLIGCCLETKVPMLVYEFIANGTLYSHLHERSSAHGTLPWKDRVRIAIETAEALAYLHSAASMSVFHRDVKSSNILLDENFTAKVSDFGISRLVPMDQIQVPTLVQGTFGYLDPEYFQTSQLTAKSDVYSFGVVLVELLTRHKPVSFERSKEDSNLAMYFLSSLKCRDLKDFIDREVMREGKVEEVSAVAELARKCLLLRGEKRPTMKEVAQELALVAGCGVNKDICGEVEQENDRGRLEYMRSLESVDTQDSLPSNFTVSSNLAR